jgi:hypothetical protein
MHLILSVALLLLLSVQHIQAQISLNVIRQPFFGEPYVYERVQLSPLLEAALTTPTTTEALLDLSAVAVSGVYDTLTYYTANLLPDSALRFVFPANTNWFVRSAFNGFTEYRGLQYVSENQQVFELAHAERRPGEDRFTTLPYDLPVQLVGVPFNTGSVTLTEPLAGQTIGAAVGVRGLVETRVILGGAFRSQDFRLDSSLVVRTTRVLLDSVTDGLALATERMRDTTYAVYSVGVADRAGWVPYFNYRIRQDMRSGTVTRSAFVLSARGVLPRAEVGPSVNAHLSAYPVPAAAGEPITLSADLPPTPITYRLVNTLGQTIFTGTLPVGLLSGIWQLSLPETTLPGAYQLTISSGDARYSVPILISK